MYDFSKVDPVKACAWLVLPTVYDESLSYGEQLNKFCKALNDLIENNNNIPDYVASMIQQYITSGAIDEVVRNILASYILNVKYPPKGIKPAVGDGSADDTEAIQGCIDYAYNQGGGCVYFPFGKYLTKSITLKSGVSLIGFDRYSTKIVQRGGDTKPLLSGGNVQNVQVSNLTLDGNNEVQTDDLDVINVLGKDVLLTNLVVKSGYQCLVYSGLGGDLQIDNVVFDGAVKKVAVISGSDSVQMSNVKFNELGQIQGECVLDVSCNSGVFKFSSKAVAPLCVKCSGSRNTFEFDCENSAKNFEDNGQFNNFNVLGVEVKEQLAQNKSIVVNGSGYNTIIGNSSEIVNENKLNDFGGNYTENIGKDKITTVKGNVTDNITGNHEVDIDGYESKHVDGISSVNIGGTRTEVYGGARNVGVTGANIEEYRDSMSETFDGKHNVNGTDENNIFSGNVNNVANKFTFNSTEKSLPINFPDKNINLYNLSSTNVFNPKDYGAKGDGLTDDTTAIQNTFDSAMAKGGGLVIFDTGTYIINDTLIIRPHTASTQTTDPQMIHFIPMDRLQIIGTGQTVIKSNSDMEYMIKTDDFSYPSNVGSYSNFYTIISGLKLDGDNKAKTGIYVYQALHSIIEYNQVFNIKNGIMVYGYGELSIRNNVIKCNDKGLVMTSGGDTLIEKNDIFLDDSCIGIDMTSFSGSTLINKNTFTPTYATEKNHTGTNNTIGINIYNGKWNGEDATTGPIHISNNSFDGVLWGIKAFSTILGKVTDIEIFNNKLVNNGYYTGCSLFSGVLIDNCMIINNNVGVNESYTGSILKCVEITNSENCVINNNLIVSSTDSPIKIYSSNNNTICCNTILNYAQKLNDAGAITLQGTSMNNIVNHNVIRQNSSGSGYSTKGVVEQGDTNYNTSEYNEFRGNITTMYEKVGVNSYFHYSGYGYNAPSNGTWNKGDIIYNEEPYANEKTFCWLCVTSGSPGTWKPIKWTE